MKIAVLAGGISTERKVSIVSGTMVCRALQEKDIRPFFWMCSAAGKTRIQRGHLKNWRMWRQTPRI